MIFALKWVGSLTLILLLLDGPALFAKRAEQKTDGQEEIKKTLQSKSEVSWPRYRALTPGEARKILPRLERKIFFKHLKTRFPKYREHFQKAAKKQNLPWKLLASQSYQESHWNRRAKSPTGVRGLMMLTRRTAASLGIRNRLDPVNSINGGAKYLARMQKRIPRGVFKRDRTFFALAAYNVGLGHIQDARTLARREKKNPNKWKDMRDILPLLSQKKYYKSLRYGYARGHEPVKYVQRIRAYHSLLDQRIPQQS
ncbi:MAG: transglycosylase SLT domain-containing protein [Nitrospirota bacterium]|nr:transglycosylase SLT domain-containing protein [Nitrospirota bacterium]